MSNSFLPTFHSDAVRLALEQVRAIDLGRIQCRLERQYPRWTPERLTAAVQGYQRFLILALLCPDEELMPFPADLDKVWHAHILHTEQYATDCQRLFGEFMHHEPADTPQTPFELRERTHALYAAVFGETLPEDDGFCRADRSQS